MTFYDKEYAEAFIRWRAEPRREAETEIAMWKKGFHGLELEIAELVKMLERVERNAVMPDTTWQLLDELINKYKKEG